MPHANLMTILYYTAPRQRGEPLHIFPLLARYSSVRAQISARNQGGGGGETHPGAAPKAAAQTLRTPSLRRARRGAGNIPPLHVPPPPGTSEPCERAGTAVRGRRGAFREGTALSGGQQSLIHRRCHQPAPAAPRGRRFAPPLRFVSRPLLLACRGSFSGALCLQIHTKVLGLRTRPQARS